MKTAVIFLVMIIMIGIAFSQQDAGISGGADKISIYNKVRNSTFTIYNYDGSGRGESLGSGFFISDDGYALTCSHVIENSFFAAAVLSNGSKYVIDEISRNDESSDLAKIHVDAPGRITDFLTINTSQPYIGQKVVVGGAPHRLENTITTGEVSGLGRINENEIPELQIDASISSGSSGGPVTDQMGEVIGVVRAEISGEEGLNFAIPASNINSFLGSWGGFLTGRESKRLLYNTTSEKAKQYCEQGDLLFIQSKYKESSDLYEEAIDLDPSFIDAWSNNAQCLYRLNELDRAGECSQRAIDLDPSFAEGWLNKGLILASANGSMDEAIRCWDNAISLGQSSRNGDYLFNKRQEWTAFLALLSKGQALMISGNDQSAIECFEMAIALFPSNDIAWNEKGIALLNEGRNSAAIECFEKALARNSGSCIYWNNLGQAYFNAGSYLDAIKYYKSSAEICPKSADVWSNLAQAHFKIGENADGQIALQKANEAKAAATSPKFTLSFLANYG